MDTQTRAHLLNSLRRFTDEILQTTTRINIMIEQRLNPAIANYNAELELASEIQVAMLNSLKDENQRDAWDTAMVFKIDPIKKIPLSTADVNAAAIIEALPFSETPT